MLQMFGFGAKAIFAQNQYAEGVVTAVKPCYWFRVRSRPIRIGYTFDDKYPHMVSFTYTVDGTRYEGKRFLSWTMQPPSEGKRLQVYYHPENPAQYAVQL